jgi:hypothetical protein
VDALLGALGADLLECTRKAAARLRLSVLDAEIALECSLANPLLALGVVGEYGDPGIERITGALYVSGDFSDQELERVWLEARNRSALATTLSRAVPMDLRSAVV